MASGGANVAVAASDGEGDAVPVERAGDFEGESAEAASHHEPTGIPASTAARSHRRIRPRRRSSGAGVWRC